MVERGNESLWRKQCRQSQTRPWRPCQYGLAHLLVSVSIAAAACSVYLHLEGRLARETGTVQKLREFGATTVSEPVWDWLPARYRCAVTRITFSDPFLAVPSNGGDPFADDLYASKTPPLLPAECIALLNRLPKLRRIDLTSMPVSACELEQLRSRSRITHLNLSRTNVASRLDVLYDFSALRSLSLSHTGTDDESLRPLATLDNLEKLDLSYTCVTDDGLSSLAYLVSLRSLNLSGTNICGPGLQQLANLKNLTHLELAQSPKLLDGVDMLGDDLAALLPELKMLDAQGTMVPSIHLHSLPILPNLTALDLTNVVLDEASVVAIARQPNLKALNLAATNLQDSWLHYLTATRLEALCTSDTPISGAGLSNLAKIQGLRRLRIERIDVLPDDLSQLQQARQLRALSLDQLTEGARAVKYLQQLYSLEFLQISNSGLTDDDVSQLRSLPNLKLLDVSGNDVAHPTLLRIQARPTNEIAF